MTHSSASVGVRPEPHSPSAPLWAGALSALLLAAVQGPSPLPLLAVAGPLPLMMQRLRGGLSGALLGALLAVALTGLAFPGWMPQLVAAGLLLPGLLMAESLARGRGLLRGCGWALLAVGALLALLLVAATGRMELRLQELLGLTAESLARVRQQAPDGQLDELLDQAARLRDGLSVVLPAAWFVLGGVAVTLQAVMLRTWLLRSDPGWLEGDELEGLRWPLFLTVPFVLSGLCLLHEPLRRGAYNALLVLAFFFALQGLSVVAYVLRRLAGPPLFRAGLAALVLLNPWASQLLVLLGLFDQWADFRRWADPPADEDDE